MAFVRCSGGIAIDAHIYIAAPEQDPQELTLAWDFLFHGLSGRMTAMGSLQGPV